MFNTYDGTFLLKYYEDFEKIGMFSLYYRLIGTCK